MNPNRPRGVVTSPLRLACSAALVASQLNGPRLGPSAVCHDGLEAIGQPPGRITVIDAFSNMRHTAEHQYGYAAELWWDGQRLLGLLVAQPGGLAGAPPTGELEAVSFDTGSCRLAFRARLSVGYVFDEAGNDFVPSRDIVRFDGELGGGALDGAFTWHRDQAPNDTVSMERVTLVASPEDRQGMEDFPSYEEWRAWADDILSFRGPK